MSESTDDERGLLKDEDVEPLTRGRRKQHRVVCGVKCDGFTAIVAGMAAFAVVVTIALVINIIIHKKSASDDQASGEITIAVSSDSATCTDLAMDLLKRNGSAVDAAVGALLCLGVVHPESSGIGGGGFMLVKNSTDTEVIDFREVAPAGSSWSMYHGNSSTMLHGGLAVGVPGELAGLVMAHRRHGNLPWEDVVMPAVKLARHGFPADKALIHALSSKRDTLKNLPSVGVLVKNLLPNGAVPVEGQSLTRPELADTLEKIAMAGSADAFYSGDIAESILSAVSATGGIMTADDLKNYQPKIRTATDVNLSMKGVEGWHILGAPPPASGACLALIAGIMDGYDHIDDSILSYHRLTEAFKFTYGQRSLLGDPGFNFSVNASRVADEMLDRKFANTLRSKIDDSRAFDESYYGGHFEVKDTPGTTHLSVLRGNDAVSVTSTINLYFGALVVTSTGIVLNNEMNDFSAPNITNAFHLPPSPANFVEPGKKPLSSQTPTIIVDEQNKVRAVVGASGGTRITTVTYQVLANMLLKGKNVIQSISEPRMHHQLRPYYVWAEQNFPTAIVEGLRAKGNLVYANNTYLAVSQAILQTADGTVTAHADVERKGGAGKVATLPA